MLPLIIFININIYIYLKKQQLLLAFFLEGAHTGEDGKKKGSTLGRFLRNLGIRKSGRKSAYKQQQGTEGQINFHSSKNVLC